MSIILPTKKVPPATVNPRRLIIYSAPKKGKTELCAALEDNLMLDFEKGTDLISALKVNIETLEDFSDVVTQLLKYKKENGKNMYKYGTIDTITAMEDFALPLALKLYKATPMGKNFDGNNILTLPNGGGYLYLRNAVDMMISQLEKCFDTLIILGHLKDTIINKNGKEVTAKDIDLTGKIKSIQCRNADTIGYLYRNDLQTIISFKTSDDTCGSRSPHLNNTEIIAAEMIDGKYVAYWDRIFLKN